MRRQRQGEVVVMVVTGDVTMVTELQGRSGASTDNVIVTAAPQLQCFTWTRHRRF